MDAQTQTQIRDIVCNILNIEIEDLAPESSFVEEHDADSMAAIEVLAALEKKFEISVDQAELSRMTNLQGVYAVVEDALGKR